MALSDAWLDRGLDRLRIFATKPVLSWSLILGNLAAVWYGWTDYYAGQLEASPGWAWPFIPDSPNAVLLFAVALGLRQFGVRSAWLDLWTWVENVKVGLWTVFVLLYYYDAFFADAPVLRWFLFWLHVGMIGQALLLHREMRTRPPSWAAYAIITAWLLVGDWLDYGPLDLHPHLRGPARPVVAAVTVALTVLVMAWAYAWYRPRRRDV